MKRSIVVLSSALALSACGSSAQLQTVQSNRNVQQTETKVEQQVRKCLPSSGGTPDPLLLTRGAQRAKFASCMGIAGHGRAFAGCAVKVVLGGLPTITRLEKGLAACVEKAA